MEFVLHKYHLGKSRRYSSILFGEKIVQTFPTVQSLFNPKKEREHISLLVFMAALWIVLLVTRCAKKTETSTTDTGTAAVAESTATTPPAISNADSGMAQLSDANIIASLSEADSAEIAEAKLVLVKSKNPE